MTLQLACILISFDQMNELKDSYSCINISTYYQYLNLQFLNFNQIQNIGNQGIKFSFPCLMIESQNEST